MTQQREGGSNSSTSDESENSSTRTDLGRPIREFIYLDLDRITSYLSQIHDGLTDYLEEAGTATQQEGHTGTQWNIGQGVWPIGMSFGRTDTINFDSTTLMQRKTSHHAALNVLLRSLEAKEVIGGINGGKPFVEARGNPLLVDYRLMAKWFREAKDLQTGLNFIGSLKNENDKKQAPIDPRDAKKNMEAEQKRIASDQKRVDNMATILEASGDRLELYFDDPKMVTPLTRENFQLTSELFTQLYRSPSRVPMTVIGLNVTGSEHELDLEAGDNMATATAFIINEYNKKVAKNFNYTQSFARILPLAIFVEADTGII